MKIHINLANLGMMKLLIFRKKIFFFNILKIRIFLEKHWGKMGKLWKLVEKLGKIEKFIWKKKPKKIEKKTHNNKKKFFFWVFQFKIKKLVFKFKKKISKPSKFEKLVLGTKIFFFKKSKIEKKFFKIFGTFFKNQRNQFLNYENFSNLKFKNWVSKRTIFF